jgi:hypothetical protein
VGVSAHALDELQGRPLGTRLPDAALIGLAGAGLVGAIGIGIAGLVLVSPTLAPFVAAGAFLVLAYNLELFGGRFHTDFWFAAAWGAFPAATSYWANALSFGIAGVLVTAGCFALSVGQRRLSSPVRELRRRTASVTGRQLLTDGSVVDLSPARMAAPLDGALSAFAVALMLVATGAVLARL